MARPILSSGLKVWTVTENKRRKTEGNNCIFARSVAGITLLNPSYRNKDMKDLKSK